MDANTAIQSEDIDGEEFCDRTFALQAKLEELCNKENHPGVTVYALMNALATNVDAMIKDNEENYEETIGQVHADLDEFFQALKEGTYYEPKKYLN